MRHQSNVQCQCYNRPQKGFENCQNMRHGYDSDKNSSDPFLYLVCFLLRARRPRFVAEHLARGDDAKRHMDGDNAYANSHDPAEFIRKHAPAEERPHDRMGRKYR